MMSTKRQTMSLKEVFPVAFILILMVNICIVECQTKEQIAKKLVKLFLASAILSPPGVVAVPLPVPLPLKNPMRMSRMSRISHPYPAYPPMIPFL